VLIEEAGVGTIRISYDPAGSILRAEIVHNKTAARDLTGKEPKEVIRKVMKEFQTLMNIIRPAGISLVNG
jgi:hypothetical protein